MDNHQFNYVHHTRVAAFHGMHQLFLVNDERYIINLDSKCFK